MPAFFQLLSAQNNPYAKWHVLQYHILYSSNPSNKNNWRVVDSEWSNTVGKNCQSESIYQFLTVVWPMKLWQHIFINSVRTRLIYQKQLFKWVFAASKALCCTEQCLIVSSWKWLNKQDSTLNGLYKSVIQWLQTQRSLVLLRLKVIAQVIWAHK